MSEVRHIVDGQVSYITLNRPEVLNALTPGQRDLVVELLDRASADPDVRAVVLTGTGRGFCAGADLRGASGAGERVAGDVARTLRLGAQRLIAAVLDCEKPVIAAVNGTAAASARTSPSPAISYWRPSRPSSSRSSSAGAWSPTAAAPTSSLV